MLKKLIITSSFIALAASGAFAEQHNLGEEKAVDVTPSMNSESTMGVDFKSLENQVTASEFLKLSVYNGNGDDAKLVGEIGDLVVSEKGDVTAVVIEVGGFLGIGEKEVAVAFDRLTWEEMNGELRLVSNLSKSELEGAPAFEPSILEQTRTDIQGMNDNSDDRDQESFAKLSDERSGEQLASFEKETKSGERMAENAADSNGSADTHPNGYIRPSSESDVIGQVNGNLVDPNMLEVDTILGSTVYGAEDENLGEIGDIILSNKKRIEAYIVNVGGFLGLGEKPVAINASEFQITKEDDGSLSLRTSFTKDELKNQPEYSPESYSKNSNLTVLGKNQTR